MQKLMCKTLHTAIGLSNKKKARDRLMASSALSTLKKENFPCFFLPFHLPSAE